VHGPEAPLEAVRAGRWNPARPTVLEVNSMKRVLPLLFFLLVVSVVAGVMMTGQRGTQVRAELARRGWRGFDCAEPAESA
jgi:hypothetical protein